jgi:predicted ArsR family transcriptional regulator
VDGPRPTAGVDPGQLEPLCSLDAPTRRRLYDYVVAQGEPVTRDGASEALGIDRSTAAYHLDRLVDEGLLIASFARPEGRGGPGAGRPAKRYERSSAEFSTSVPPRDYRLAAELLARAAEADRTGTVHDALARAAEALGRELTADESADDLLDHLARHGFEPYRDGEVIRLRNCPFHRLATTHPELVCGMNRALLAGTVKAADAAYEARLEPADGRCCVALVPAPEGGAG